LVTSTTGLEASTLILDNHHRSIDPDLHANSIRYNGSDCTRLPSTDEKSDATGPDIEAGDGEG
jgi:hypothetical protein